MKAEVPEEFELLVKSVRQFVQRELEPAAEVVEREGRVPEEAVAKLRGAGYFGLTIPARYGGTGLGVLPYCLVQEELAQTHSCFGTLIAGNNGIGSHALVHFGTEEQKAKYLPALARGEVISAFALSEPNAGSDAEGIETTAHPLDGGFMLNGRKHFISRATVADLFTVMAVTDRAARPKRKGITAFLVERGTPGFTIGPAHRTMGSDVVPAGEVTFDECRIPASNVIGEVGGGFAVAMSTLAEGRLNVAAKCVGTARRLLDLSVRYSKERVQFGRPICQNQAIQWMLADSATEIAAGRALLYSVASCLERGEDVRRESSMVKLFCSEMVGRVADRAVQIHGGMGYMSELPVERMYREVRLWRIVEGTSEIQRLIVARSLLEE
ncbi:MAG: acyl-CoA dehydrogenase family protein [Candidatus Rokubacteria bacterium]|nr:acyl-CoA dehydrogenase family protein [Candidatus Rokubacteria bacterium]